MGILASDSGLYCDVELLRPSVLERAWYIMQYSSSSRIYGGVYVNIL